VLARPDQLRSRADGRGVAALRTRIVLASAEGAPLRVGLQELHLGDCLTWLAQAPRASVSAVVTDPPYGLVEYAPEQQRKLREGRGGIWRIPPAFDGANRRALPRFTVLAHGERDAIRTFFEGWGNALLPVLRPGAHVAIAGNQLTSPLVADGLERAGFERRGEIARLVRTFRGGDRPKGAEAEFADLSTMPRTCWEPWGLYRRPLGAATVAENLRLHGTGALRRLSADTPFLDVIPSGVTPKKERAIAPHPSLKPQAFLRRIVAALCPRPGALVLDPFAGTGSTLAACEALGIEGVGVERDPAYYEVAVTAVPRLARLRTDD
jgi:site-specific DNA-methyltransferase (adenine-specific)